MFRGGIFLQQFQGSSACYLGKDFEILRKNLPKLCFQPVDILFTLSLEIEVFPCQVTDIEDQIIGDHGYFQVWPQAQASNFLGIQLVIVDFADVDVLIGVGNKGIENKNLISQFFEIVVKRIVIDTSGFQKYLRAQPLPLFHRLDPLYCSLQRLRFAVDQFVGFSCQIIVWQCDRQFTEICAYINANGNEWRFSFFMVIPRFLVSPG